MKVIQIIFGVFIFAFTLGNLVVQAQISMGGSPAAVLDIKELVLKRKEHAYVPSKAQLKDAVIERKGQALKFAHQFTVDYTPENSGTWIQMANGSRVWRLLISSPGAYTINLIFDRYVLPKGGKLFIYNLEQTDVKGAFTEANNSPSGVLATAPVIGDQLIVEYQEPADAEFKAELLIGAVNHDFLGIHQLKYGVSFGDADECNVDVSCYQDDSVQDVRRSVVKIVIDGRELCSGTMINSTGSVLKPYLITSAHCFALDATANTTLLYFDYEIPYCAPIIEGCKDHTLSGGVAKVMANELDIALVEMNNMPPAHYRPYFAGWTLSSAPTKPFKTIHHPWGDVKKISTFDGDLLAYSFNVAANAPYAQIDDFHWRVSRWTTGTTEPGSSGAAIFDSNNNFVGALSGGAATCYSPINDYYTQFYKAWDQHGAANEQYKLWLDPVNSGVQSLPGVDPYQNQMYTRLSNVESGDSPLHTSIDVEGYLTGHNQNKATVFAERYAGIKSATIRGAYLSPSKSKWGSAQTFNLLLWQGTDKPETLLEKKEGIKLDQLRANEEKYIEFTTPVEVVGNFFVGYEINYDGSPIDTMAVYCSGRAEKVNNTMMVYDDVSGWKYGSDLYQKMNYSLMLDVLASAVEYGDTQIVSSPEKSIQLFPVPATGNDLYINSNGAFIKWVDILDINGRVLATEYLNSSGAALPVKIAGLSSGVYILKLFTKDRQLNKKFVIE